MRVNILSPKLGISSFLIFANHTSKKKIVVYINFYAYMSGVYWPYI